MFAISLRSDTSMEGDQYARIASSRSGRRLIGPCRVFRTAGSCGRRRHHGWIFLLVRQRQQHRLSAGWFLSAGAHLTESFAVVGDISGHYKSQTAASGGVTVTASSSVYTFMAGPRVVGHSGPLGFYGQLLVGAARFSGGASASSGGISSSFSASDSEFCYAPGAGVEFGLARNAAARVGVSERLIHSTAGTSNEFQLQLGLVYRFGAGK